MNKLILLFGKYNNHIFILLFSSYIVYDVYNSVDWIAKLLSWVITLVFFISIAFVFAKAENKYKESLKEKDLNE